ncbi:MAG: translocation/assembly module TamB domain-containing protein [Bacteroidales bacterium]
MIRIIKCIVSTVGIALFLLLLIPFLLYIPAIQNKARIIATEIASSKLNMDVSLESVSLRFPLDLELRRALVVTAGNDTLIKCDALVLNIGLRKIFQKEIEIKELCFENTKIHFADSAKTLNLRINVDELKLSAQSVNIGSQVAYLPDVTLKGGGVSLKLVSTPPDTTASSPFNWAFHVGNLILDNIAFEMETSPDNGYLKSGIGYAHLKEGRVDVGKREVKLCYAGVSNARCTFLFAPNSEQDTVVSINKMPSLPWSVCVDSISLQNGNVVYGKRDYIPKIQFDPDYISVSELNIAASKVYSRDAVVKVKLGTLSFIERSGFRLTHAEGNFVMDSSRMAMQNFRLNTYYSQITGNVDADVSVLKRMPDASVFANVKADISLLDVAYFEPAFGPSLGIFPVNSIKAVADLRGTLSDISLRNISAVIPGYAGISLNGSLYGLVGKVPLSGRININGAISDGSFVSRLINPAMDTTIVLPNDIKFGGVVAIRGDSIAPVINLRDGNGEINLAGGINVKTERYTLSLDIADFPFGDIFPNNGFGLLSASVSASGRKFNPMKSGAVIGFDLAVDSLDYNGYNYENINLSLKTGGGKYCGSLKSLSEAAQAEIKISGILTDIAQSADITGVIGNLDLQKLNFTEDRIVINTQIDLMASTSGYGVYRVSGGLGTTNIFMYGVKRTLPDVNIDFSSDSSSVTAVVSAEEFAMDFASPVSLKEFISGIDNTVNTAILQADSLDIDAQKLHDILPPCHFSVRLGDNPVITTILKRNNIQLKEVDVNLMSSEDKPLDFSAAAYGFKSGIVEIDTTTFTVSQDTSRFVYNLYLNNKMQNADKYEKITLYGSLLKNIISLNYKQQSDTGEIGFLFGSDIEVDTNRVHFTVIPLDPIIGYGRCTVNAGNYVDYYFNNRIKADLKISSGERYLSLYSPEGRGENDLGVKISSVDISSLLSLWPLAPSVSGILSSDMILTFSKEHISAAGNLDVKGLTYNEQMVGDVALNMNYSVEEDKFEHINVSLDIGNNEVVTVTGIYDPSERAPVALRLLIKSFPLISVNPFLPEDYAKFMGVLNGDMSLDGKPDNFKLNGFLQFANGTLNIPMIGTTFDLSDEKISVVNNVININNFGLSGPNHQPLNINGSIALGNISDIISDFYGIKSDLTISAKNFQLVNVKKNNRTQVYGKAFADIDVSVKGALNTLKINGNAALLNGTEITYTMRESTIGQQEDVSNLVTFVSFNDTINQDDIIPVHRAPWGMDMTVDVSIGQAVKMAVNLTADGETGLNIQGGGNIVYTMNMLGDTRFVGRYNITSGMVRYSPPIISAKTFKITQGSYVEWIGDVADPLLNIKAEQKIKSSVTENGANKLVNFWVVIMIKNTLDNLDIVFNLTAPEDMTISNELAAMTPEQRSEQAVSMMVYNSYTGGSNTQSAFDANTALNSFLQKELNQWSRNNLKNVDLTFGVDSYKSASGTSSTDYSYELSKTLFNDRFKVVVGGSYNTDVAPDKVAQSLIGDVTLEYQLDERDNMLLKIFSNTENDILEGTIIDYGVGFAVRKQVVKLKELFEITGRKAKIEKKKAVKREEEGR